ncbi:MAG: hypothetical protein JWM05_1365 [Acidimicrobiales bacterium]|nr:hypothetical protein [Acidimicrobiales bacterium]
MEPRELEIREAVRDTLARATHAGDRGRAAELAACFTGDGVLDVGAHGGRWVGRAEIEAQISATVERIAAAGDSAGSGPVHHHVSSTVIDVATSQEATASSYFVVLTAVGVDHWGRYRDRLRPEADRWLLSERVVRVDGHVASSVVVPR